MVQTGLWTSNGVTRSYSTHAFLCALATVMLNIGTLLIGGAAVVSDGTCTHCTRGRITTVQEHIRMGSLSKSVSICNSMVCCGIWD